MIIAAFGAKCASKTSHSILGFAAMALGWPVLAQMGGGTAAAIGDPSSSMGGSAVGATSGPTSGPSGAGTMGVGGGGTGAGPSFGGAEGSSSSSFDDSPDSGPNGASSLNLGSTIGSGSGATPTANDKGGASNLHQAPYPPTPTHTGPRTSH